MQNSTPSLAGSIVSLLVRLVGAVAAIATSIVIARHTSIDTFGLYLFLLSCVSLGSLVLIYGVDVVMSRLVSKQVRLAHPEQLPGILRWATRRLGRRAIVMLLILTLAIAVVAVTNGVQRGSWPKFEQLNLTLTLMSFILLVVLSCKAVLRGFLQGLAFRWAVLPEQLLRPILMFGLVTAGLALAIVPTATQLIGYAVLASVLALSIALYWVHREAHQVGVVALWAGNSSMVESAEVNSTLYSAGLGSVFILAAAQLMLGQGDVLVLGLLRGPTETGLYGAAAQLMLMFVFGLAAFIEAYTPQLRQLLEERNFSALVRLSRWLYCSAVAGTAISILGLWFAGPWLLGLFGDSYLTNDTLLALRILLVAQLPLAVAITLGGLLVVAAREKQAAVIALMAAMVNLVLNLALVSRLGILGAAVATTAALFLQSAIVWWFARRIGLI